MYDEVVRLEPNHADAWYNKGNSLAALERHEEASRSYDEAVRLNPSYFQAWFNKGNALRRLGRMRDAADAYRHFVDTAPPAQAETVSAIRQAIPHLEQR